MEDESADDTQDIAPSAARTLSIIGVSAAAFIAAMYFAIGPWTGGASIDDACALNIPEVPDGAGVTYTSELHLGWRPHWTCEYRIGGEPVSVDVGWVPSRAVAWVSGHNVLPLPSTLAGKRSIVIHRR